VYGFVFFLTEMEPHRNNKSDTVEILENQNHNQEVRKSTRRPDIDIIIIGVTWCILLFHTCLVYAPLTGYYVMFPETDSKPIAEDKFTFIPIGYLIQGFIGFMHAWNMPMFFFLSGSNAYFALFRRTETQFRDERVHRLLVPTLFVSVVTQIPLSLDYFAPLNPACQHYYNGTNSTDNCNLFKRFTKNDTFLDHLRGFYNTDLISAHQAWFLLYLFIYSQIFTHPFRAWHPNHNTADEYYLSCCGYNTCCCSKKPFNCLTRCFCCLRFLWKTSTTPQEFVAAVEWFLGGAFKLCILPSILIGLLEIINFFNLPINGGPFPFFTYMVIFVFGYAITASEDTILKGLMEKYRWIYFMIGLMFCNLFSFLGIYLQVATPKRNWLFLFGIAYSLCRGLGLWMFILGSLGLARKNIITNYSWIAPLREIAMPFYVTHQQVLVALLSGALWVPYLRTFPIIILLATILTMIVSFLITKAGPLRYFFGLKDSSDFLPGKPLRGFIPTLILSGMVLVLTFLANFLRT
jgi:hypothetical protein